MRESCPAGEAERQFSEPKPWGRAVFGDRRRERRRERRRFGGTILVLQTKSVGRRKCGRNKLF